MSHFKDNKLFTTKQFGFMGGRSTSLQLLKVHDPWMEALDQGYDIDCIYMDYQKAFDTVPHRRLLKKLEVYDIGSKTINWISEYLTNRKQHVSINNSTSKWHNGMVTSGIPQGSVLFIIFIINDLLDIVNSTVSVRRSHKSSQYC